MGYNTHETIINSKDASVVVYGWLPEQRYIADFKVTFKFSIDEEVFDIVFKSSIPNNYLCNMFGMDHTSVLQEGEDAWLKFMFLMVDKGYNASTTLMYMKKDAEHHCKAWISSNNVSL